MIHVITSRVSGVEKKKKKHSLTRQSRLKWKNQIPEEEHVQRTLLKRSHTSTLLPLHFLSLILSLSFNFKEIVNSTENSFIVYLPTSFETHLVFFPFYGTLRIFAKSSHCLFHITLLDYSFLKNKNQTNKQNKTQHVKRVWWWALTMFQEKLYN